MSSPAFLNQWRAMSAAMQFRKLFLDTKPEKGIPAYREAMDDLVKGMSNSDNVEDRNLQFELMELILKYTLYYEGCIYTGDEWRARESYGENARFVMSCEGDVCHAFYYNTCPEAAKEFAALVEKHGFYFEWLHCWAVAFYKDD